MKKIFEILTDEAKAEVLYLIRNKQNALDMVASNYFGTESFGVKEVVNRLQVQYFALNPNVSDLQAEGKSGWWQNEEYEVNTVNGDIYPLVQTETTEKEWGKKYYSSFALNKENNNFEITFPLKEDYLSTSFPFKFKDMSTENFDMLVNELENKLSVKIESRRIVSKNFKKASGIYKAFAKIKNSCLKLVKKYDLISGTFAGKLYIAERSNSNYKYSNVEKTVKIYDTLFTKVIRRKENALKDKINKHLTRDLKLASRLLSNILMCRITNFGDSEINKKVEKCLSLQFANVLNKNSFTSSQLNIITEMATGVVCDICKKMEYTTENIANMMTNNGFVYENAPQNEKEALLLAKEKDYTIYMEALREPAKNMVDKKDKNTTSNNNAIVPVGTTREPIKKYGREVALVPVITKSKTEDNARRLKKGDAVAEITPGTSVVVYKKDQEDAKKLLEDGEETLRLAEGKKAKVLKPGEIAGLLTPSNSTETPIEALETPAASIALLPAGNEKQSNNSEIAGYLPSGYTELDREDFIGKYNNRLPIELDRLPFLDKIIKKVEEKKANKKLSKKTIAKYIDKQMEKTLVENIVKITNAINANRCSKYGGKVKAKRQANVLAMVLAYYKKREKGVLKTTKASQKNNETLYSRCQQLTSLIFCLKDDIINKIVNVSENTPANVGESTSKYINRLAKDVCKVGQEEGVDIKTYVAKLIDSYSSIYADGEFKDIYDKDKK